MELIMPDFASLDVWMALLTLTFLEIVLGIDNIIFISIASNKLPKEQQGKATNVGLVLAMAMRIVLLFGISALVAMSEPWFSSGYEMVAGEIHESGDQLIRYAFSGQSLILIAGGIFLLYKSTTEIHHKLEGDGEEQADGTLKKAAVSLGSVIFQITIINIVFSFDSILTAVGMTTGVHGALVIMIIAVVISVLIMMLFAVPVGRFVNKHPTIQMLGLAFLILIGFMLIVEGAHMAEFVVGTTHVDAVPKGYLYFAIAFSLLVEFLNMKLRKKTVPVQLHGVKEEAEQEGMFKER